MAWKPMIPLSEILEKFLQKKKIGQTIKRHEIFEGWTEVVGAKLAEHTVPQKFLGDTLFVAVDHPTWIQELQFVKEALLKKINQAYPKSRIKNLRFVLN